MARYVGEVDVDGRLSHARVTLEPAVEYVAAVVDFVVLLARIVVLGHEFLEEQVDLRVVLVRVEDEGTAC